MDWLYITKKLNKKQILNKKPPHEVVLGESFDK